ncbi:MAG: acylase [Gemmatimonadetes bacterium]|nr:acylase [Gemmatimonadota bacterium]MBI3567791.1 acylase [Gemmatimonadota bacterium]
MAPHRRLLALALLASACGGAWRPDDSIAAARTFDVRILRDTFGVPHVRGHTDADVAFGVAYAQAEDDWPTLEQVFAGTRARAAALVGKDGAGVDYVMHLLRVREDIAAKARTDIDSATWKLVDGYAAGINYYAARHPAEVSGVVRALLPMTGADVVAGFVLKSPFFFGFDAVLNALVNNTPIPHAYEEKGSNGFAVAPRRSGDGVTRLLSNSHQPWTGAVAWYELSVHSDEGLDFAGANFPGAPLPLLGHNATLGWTNTVNKPDLVDVYRLRINPGDKDQYWFDGAWHDLERERVWLHVKFGPITVPVPRMVYRSVHGPVIRNDSGTFALRYAGMDDVRPVMQYYRITKARSYDEWRAAMKLQAIPATNFIYADSTGRIAYVYNAEFPRRRPGYDWRGILPGDTSATLWNGYVPFDSIPQYVSPKSGYLFNSNNTPFVATSPSDALKPADFPDWMGIERGMTNRAQRDVELLDSARVISRDVLLATKFDVSYSRRSWVGRWLDAVARVDPRGDARLADGQRLLATWNLTMSDSQPASVLGAMTIGPASRAINFGGDFPDARETLKSAVDWLMATHQRLDPPMHDVIVDEHGATIDPVVGAPDLLRAVYFTRDAHGHLAGNAGDSFIMLVEWGRDGVVHSQSIHQFGAATSRPGSKHYADQIPLFVARRWKSVPFTEAEQRSMLEREYRVGR